MEQHTDSVVILLKASRVSQNEKLVICLNTLVVPQMAWKDELNFVVYRCYLVCVEDSWLT